VLLGVPLLGASTNKTWQGEITDEWGEITPSDHEINWQGRIYGVATHTIDIGGEVVEREVTLHPGAVSVLCLNERDEVLLLRQYRHPVGAYLFEPPAGLMDKSEESPLHAAQRELAEEAGMRADRWDVLIDFYNSPGGSSEAHRIFLARDITRLAQGRTGGDGAEENDMAEVWVKLDVALGLVQTGALANPTAVIGILAAHTARQQGWAPLRRAESPWDAREKLAQMGRLPK
jgi:ADP-ribose pyrophosphatase